MNPLTIVLAATALAGTSQIAAATRPQVTTVSQTVTGIPLDTAWKRSIYVFAQERLLHPAWGWTHSERDYQLAVEIAEREGLKIDRDILFAAAFVHDVGAIGDFQKDGVDHAVRSVELARAILRDAGFPVEKIPAVQEAILGHMHDKTPGKSNEAIVLHDADTVDFLGTVGIARRLSVTGSATDYNAGIARIREFADKLPARTVTATARQMASRRAAEMKRFLNRLAIETANGRIP
jgi:uncharacterized protein